ncbi:MAG: hypothetical protein CM15mP84_02610 [Cellvibrionales bacterium]|nr:MAG: hypothetical protein CM15mP84_02610 [Cellvibrionales bacterium]
MDWVWGPTVGILSDQFAGRFGDDNLRYAMVTTLTISLVGVFFLWMGCAVYGAISTPIRARWPGTNGKLVTTVHHPLLQTALLAGDARHRVFYLVYGYTQG